MAALRPARSLVLLACLAGCRADAQAERSVEPEQAGIGEAAGSSAPAILRGHIRNHEGQALAAARLEAFTGTGPAPVLSQDLAADGGFELELPGPGIYRLRLAGVDHAEIWEHFMATGGPIELEAKLGTYARQLEGDTLKLRLRYVDGEGQPGAPFVLEAEAQTGGEAGRRFALALEPPATATGLQYQIVDASGRSYNGPGGARWVYDGGGDFWAEIDLEGRERLELDLAQLSPSGRPPEVVLGGAGVVASRDAEAQFVILDQRNAVHALRQTREDALAGGKTKAEAEAETCPELAALADAARAQVEAVEDPELRAYAALDWGQLFGYALDDCLAPGDLEWIFEHAPADHVAWAFLGIGVDNVFGAALDAPALTAFRHELAAHQTEPALLAHLLFLDLIQADERGDDEALAELYTLLARDYPESMSKRLAAEYYDPQRPIQPGRPMPAWSFADLEGGRIQSKDLRGQAYFLEVWATWCGPCVADMPTIHATHSALVEAGEAIVFVSVSIDERPETVEAFRADQWPMPWVHGFVAPAELPALNEAWQFSGVPMPVLVDAEGMIVAARKGLRGDKLRPTLEAHLAGSEK